jgi:hypothetical protein
MGVEHQGVLPASLDPDGPEWRQAQVNTWAQVSRFKLENQMSLEEYLILVQSLGLTEFVRGKVPEDMLSPEYSVSRSGHKVLRKTGVR